MKNFILGLLFFITFLSLNAQTKAKIEICNTDEYYEKQREKFPELETKEEFEAWMAPLVEEQLAEGRTTGSCNGPINVIFHVVYGNQAVGVGDNLSSELIYAQIEQLNADFASAGINFAPAPFNENGDPLDEPGIERISFVDMDWDGPTFGVCVGGVTNPTYVHEVIKPQTYWDPNRFLNVWTVALIEPNSGCSLLGNAQYPNSSGLEGIGNNNGVASSDGIIVIPNVIGSLSVPNPIPIDIEGGGSRVYGRVLTHEMGHFFGLRHIYGAGGCGSSDFCEDTNEQSEPNIECEEHYSCGSIDMIENHMDVSPDQCKTSFTPDQISRMTVVLENSPRRGSLCCGGPIEVDFHFENENGGDEDVFCAGEDVFISGTTTGEVNHTYIEVKRRELASNDGWVWLIGLQDIEELDFNFGDWLEQQNHTLEPGDYSIKIAIQNSCEWVDLIKEFEIHPNQATPIFHFEDFNENVREVYCSSEQVFINGSASYGEVRYILEVGRAPIGTIDFESLGLFSWVQGPCNTFNLSQYMGMPLEGGYVYEVKLAVQNDCDPWSSTTGQFVFEQCCEAPTGLTCITIGGDPYLTWVPALGATSYNVVLDFTSDCCGNPGPSASKTHNVPNNLFKIKNLTWTCFEWRVQTVCDDNETSAFSDPECYSLWDPCWGFAAMSDLTSVNEIQQELMEPTISPNPSTGQALISLEVHESSSIQIDIYNTDGRLVKNFFDENVPGGSYQKEWRADAGLPNGIYIVHVNVGQSAFQKKIVLAR